jgi:hypothetical protein
MFRYLLMTSMSVILDNINVDSPGLNLIEEPDSGLVSLLTLGLFLSL